MTPSALFAPDSDTDTADDADADARMYLPTRTDPALADDAVVPDATSATLVHPVIAGSDTE